MEKACKAGCFPVRNRPWKCPFQSRRRRPWLSGVALCALWWNRFASRTDGFLWVCLLLLLLFGHAFFLLPSRGSVPTSRRLFSGPTEGGPHCCCPLSSYAWLLWPCVRHCETRENTVLGEAVSGCWSCVLTGVVLPSTRHLAMVWGHF